MTVTSDIYGASIHAPEHAQLATRAGVLAMLAASPNANERTRAGVGLVAHTHDLDYARAWLAQAAAVVSRVESRRARMDSEPITDDECAEMYRAIGNFFRALNVCPYAWKRFRWRMEDLLGAPRNRDERSLAGLDVSGITAAESEASDLRGITWRRRTEGGAAWFDQRNMGWSERRASSIIEEFSDGSTRTTEYTTTPEYAPGVWRRSVAALVQNATPTQVAGWDSARSAVGTSVYFGRPSDIGVQPPGVGDLRGGIPNNLSQWERLPTGENHRVWLTNDGRVYRQPGADTLQPFSALQVVDLTRMPDGTSAQQWWNTGSAPGGIWDRIANAGDPSNRAFVAGVQQVPIASLPDVPDADLGGRSIRDALVLMPVSPVVVPAEWYWQIFAAPAEGLRPPGGNEDVSLLEYIRLTGPVAMIREILRDTVARNLALMESRGFQTEAQLFGAARQADLASAAGGAAQVVEQSQALRTTQAAFGVLTTVAAAVPVAGPIAGAIVGAGGLVGMVIAELTRDKATASTVSVDVFGRMVPAWERFEIIGNRVSLEGVLRSPEMQPGGPGSPPPPSRTDAARRLEQNIAEIARGENSTREGYGVMDGAVVVGTTLTPTRTERVRTVVLYGLDPVGGARVYADDGVRPWAEREITVAPQESGMAARWQSSAEYGPTWVFGVSDRVPRIRVVYPDGSFRVIALPPAPGTTEEGDAVVTRTPVERTAFVDATPPPSTQDQNTVVVQGMNETRNAEFPPRTVVLVGMQPGTRVFAQGSDVTDAPMLNGDTARWIDSVPGNPGPQGWSFGVSLDNTRALELVLPDGTRRTLALPALRPGASVTERVTVIDLTGSPASGQYPSRTVVLVGMPQDARVFKGAEDITNIPMLTGDAARWIDSTIGVPGWAFGVPDGTRVIEIVTLSGQRVPVTLPPMDPSLSIGAKVTTVDVRSYFPADTAQAGMGGGGGGGVLLLAGFAAAVAAGYYFKDR